MLFDIVDDRHKEALETFHLFLTLSDLQDQLLDAPLVLVASRVNSNTVVAHITSG
jgi:hypothetical protein